MQVVSESHQNHQTGAVSNQLTEVGGEGEWVSEGYSESVDLLKEYTNVVFTN